jgi:hypothetical protein
VTHGERPRIASRDTTRPPPRLTFRDLGAFLREKVNQGQAAAGLFGIHGCQTKRLKQPFTGQFSQPLLTRRPRFVGWKVDVVQDLGVRRTKLTHGF